MTRQVLGHCPDCEREWSALGQAHCVQCCRHFSTYSAADAHLNRHSNCAPPESLVRKGKPVLVLREGDIWGWPSYDATMPPFPGRNAPSGPLPIPGT